MKRCLITLSLCLFLCPISELRAETEVLESGPSAEEPISDDRLALREQLSTEAPSGIPQLLEQMRSFIGAEAPSGAGLVGIGQEYHYTIWNKLNGTIYPILLRLSESGMVHQSEDYLQLLQRVWSVARQWHVQMGEDFDMDSLFRDEVNTLEQQVMLLRNQIVEGLIFERDSINASISAETARSQSLNIILRQLLRAKAQGSNQLDRLLAETGDNIEEAIGRQNELQLEIVQEVVARVCEMVPVHQTILEGSSCDHAIGILGEIVSAIEENINYIDNFDVEAELPVSFDTDLFGLDREHARFQEELADFLESWKRRLNRKLEQARGMLEMYEARLVAVTNANEAAERARIENNARVDRQLEYLLEVLNRLQYDRVNLQAQRDALESGESEYDQRIAIIEGLINTASTLTSDLDEQVQSINERISSLNDV